ncbi:MAG: hypothetical protein R3D44_00850 [Hyphomicrobiaceae bacterium]
MTVEPIGIITIILGVLILRKGPGLGIVVLLCSFLLGAAAAVKLPALGGSSIAPAYVILLFYVASILRMPDSLAHVVRLFGVREAGFWLLCYAVYGALGALFLPRVFAGEAFVFSLQRLSAGGDSAITLTPLAFGTGNITQTVYLLADVVCFAAVAAHVRMRGFSAVATAVLFAGSAHFLLGVLDSVDHSFAAGEMLTFIRNANYAILAEGDVGGIRRTIGAFTEASAFGGVALPFFAFTSELYFRGIRPWLTGLVALCSLLAVIASLSSSALVGLAIYAGFIFVRGSALMLVGASTARLSSAVVALPSVLLVAALVLALKPDAAFWIDDVADQLFLDKLESDSGIERASWNEYGWDAFFDTSMLGAGVGSIRTSSYLVAILANTGLPGLVLVGVFLALLCIGHNSTRRPRVTAGMERAAVFACFACLLPAMLVGSSVVFGLLFSTLAGLAVATGQDRFPHQSRTEPRAFTVPSRLSRPDPAATGAA